MEIYIAVGMHSHTDIRGYSTLKKAIEKAPQILYGKGEYNPDEIITPCPAQPYYDVRYRQMTNEIEEGYYHVEVYIYPLILDDDDTAFIATIEHFNYIKGLQS